MIRRVIMRPLAVEDIAEAATWYEDQLTGLGGALIDEVVEALRRAQAAPGLFPTVRPQDGMRRVLTNRFPYRVFFTVVDDVLHVHSVMHGARHDRHWRARK